MFPPPPLRLWVHFFLCSWCFLATLGGRTRDLYLGALQCNSMPCYVISHLYIPSRLYRQGQRKLCSGLVVYYSLSWWSGNLTIWTCGLHSVREPLCDVLCLGKVGNCSPPEGRWHTAPFMAGNYELSHIREDMDPRSIDWASSISISIIINFTTRLRGLLSNTPPVTMCSGDNRVLRMVQCVSYWCEKMITTKSLLRDGLGFPPHLEWWCSRPAHLAVLTLNSIR
jgi:hypothetical protein